MTKAVKKHDVQKVLAKIYQLDHDTTFPTLSRTIIGACMRVRFWSQLIYTAADTKLCTKNAYTSFRKGLLQFATATNKSKAKIRCFSASRSQSEAARRTGLILDRRRSLPSSLLARTYCCCCKKGRRNKEKKKTNSAETAVDVGI
jgi:hypothetical protein